MSLIAVKSLSLTLGTPLFADLSFTVAPADRIGLVAANGRGKSSLLRCLAGGLDPTSGDVTQARGLKIGLVEQDVPDALLCQTLREATLSALPAEEADSEGWRVDVTLDALDVPEAFRDRALGDLSGGWQRTALLARAAVGEPDLYLLDEPTNHLDLGRIGRLTDWLAALPRAVAVIAASHDRAFLDEATGRTLFLRAERSRIFGLPYSAARAALDQGDEADARQFDNRMKEAAQLRRQATKLKNIGINSGSDLLTVKTRQLTERAGRIELAARPAYQERTAGVIRLANGVTHAKALVTLNDASVAAPDGRLLFRTGQKWIERGDRVVVLGPNGAGKTCLIGAILSAIRVGGGEAIRSAPSLVLGHSDQALAQLSDRETPFAVITRFDLGDQAARTHLAGAGIRPDRQTGPIAALSGGQRARLAMLALRLAKPNFYLLDEPTNHLDIDGQEALEAELLAHGATCLLVSHDRSFVRNVGNRFWRIDGKRLTEVGDPEDFFCAQLAGG
jgi:ATPase subunit of ABC transporter with duplicated ATPase domains